MLVISLSSITTTLDSTTLKIFTKSKFSLSAWLDIKFDICLLCIIYQKEIFILHDKQM